MTKLLRCVSSCNNLKILQADALQVGLADSKPSKSSEIIG
eukprot:CAMPEP_0173102406 /NCGR_PEP_ID=MMETSP1102-20130122/37552_1 /TAXON_ID=49646 /ORGANISM="Geminigera sp., Strain Caron Lab Isolate" /LENGTH=39 /DNA_ID= /DNA_START= /DNA_END= /DNA_ORIENTATION=